MKTIIASIICVLLLIHVNAKEIASLEGQSLQMNNEIAGIWAAYAKNDPLYGTAVTVYDFKDDGRFRAIIVSIPNFSADQEENDVAVLSVVLTGTYKVSSNMLYLVDNANLAAGERSYSYVRKDDVLLLSHDEQRYVLLRTKSSER